MKYQLRGTVNPNCSAIEQVLTNRGIPHDEINHYLHTTDADINSPLAFGQEILQGAAAALLKGIKENQSAIVIVDADCDGFTSAALLINYLHDIFPDWANQYLTYSLHNGKQHGLNDHIKELLPKSFGLVLIPDAGSNDIEECKELKNNGSTVIILDHHICEVDNPYAFVVNNQSSDYPNKDLSGVGVTWQFCRYLDSLLKQNFADQYLDLVALGLKCLG